eukprot:SAG11_NODE_1117_length_5798_cov_10.203194_4_plen_132_part_00
MTNFPRFDLQEVKQRPWPSLPFLVLAPHFPHLKDSRCLQSSYAMLLMADRTPAWREVYTEVLDGLTKRYTAFWAAVDWLTQFGDDPDRQAYPEVWKGMLIPAHLWGCAAPPAHPQIRSPAWVICIELLSRR